MGLSFESGALSPNVPELGGQVMALQASVELLGSQRRIADTASRSLAEEPEPPNRESTDDESQRVTDARSERFQSLPIESSLFAAHTPFKRGESRGRLTGRHPSDTPQDRLRPILSASRGTIGISPPFDRTRRRDSAG